MGVMDIAAFNTLLGPVLGSRLVWIASHRCPCAQEEGAADLNCGICGGLGRWFDAPSVEFRAGLVGLTAKALERMAVQFGPGLIGDATVSLPETAACYQTVGVGDRLVALDAMDTLEWHLVPRTPVKLPYLGVQMDAWTRNGAVIVRVPPPSPAADGTVSVQRPTTVRLRAPRTYEVNRDLAQIRGWQPGLPKKLLLKLIDVTTR